MKSYLATHTHARTHADRWVGRKWSTAISLGDWGKEKAQICKNSGTWYVAIDLVNVFSSIPIRL